MIESKNFLFDGEVVDNYWRQWLPKGFTKGVIVIAHGLAEHSGRYIELAETLAAAGFIVYAIDHIGHGQSLGQRTHIKEFDDYVNPLIKLARKAKADNPTKPIIILGHSMGGLIAVSLLLKEPSLVDGCILSGPALQVLGELKPSQRLLLKLFSSLFPKLGMVELDADGVNSDPLEVQVYRDDPLVFTGKMSARCAGELIRRIDYVRARFSRISLPLLLLHGGEDSLASPGGTKHLYEKASSEDKKLIIYDGLYHEIFHEADKEQIFSEVIKWLEDHL